MEKAYYSPIYHCKKPFLSKHFILSNSKPLLCLPLLFETLPLSFCFEFGPHFLLFLIILSCPPALAIFSPGCLNHSNVCGKLHFLFLLPFKPHLLGVFSENQQPTFCSSWFYFKHCTFSPLNIWQVISSTIIRKMCPFYSIIVALICTLSFWAMKASLKSRSLSKAKGKPCLKICPYS